MRTRNRKSTSRLTAFLLFLSLLLSVLTVFPSSVYAVATESEPITEQQPLPEETLSLPEQTVTTEETELENFAENTASVASAVVSSPVIQNAGNTTILHERTVDMTVGEEQGLRVRTTLTSAQNVTFSVNNPQIVSIVGTSELQYGDAYATIRANKEGTVVVTAKVKNGDTVLETVSMEIYVVMADGIYQIKSCATHLPTDLGDYYLRSDNLDNVFSSVYASTNTYGETVDNIYRYWKIEYAGNGEYYILPLANDEKILKVVSGSVVVSVRSYNLYERWKISYRTGGYEISSNWTGDACIVLNSNTATLAGNDNNPYYHTDSSLFPADNMMFEVWQFALLDISGIYFRKESNQKVYETCAVLFSVNNIEYDFSESGYSVVRFGFEGDVKWASQNSRIATVASLTGSITAKNSGKIPILLYADEKPDLTATLTLMIKPQSTQAVGINSGSVYMIKNVSKNKYLYASDSNTLTLKNKGEMDGKQLWYVEWTGNGYRLYSMGVKAALPGSSESLLQGNSVSNSPLIRTAQLVPSKWTIDYNGGYYYLVNNSASYNDTSLSADSSSDNIRHISLTNETSYAKWKFEEIPTSTFNNYWSGTYIGQGSTVYIKINIDDTGSDSVYRNSIINEDHFDVIDNWKNISNHVIIYGPNDTVPSNITAFQITFKGDTSFEDDDYGRMDPYNAQEKITSSYVDWKRVTIMLNTSVNGALAGGSDDLIEKVIQHELGHALKLAHPKQTSGLPTVTNGRGGYTNDSSVIALMNQGNPNATTILTCATPKWHDIINLRNKWGN